MGREHFSPLTPGLIAGQLEGGGFEQLEFGTIHTVTAKGATAELDSVPRNLYGPAGWSLGAADSMQAAIDDGVGPRPGDRCVVGFVGADHVPFILGWTR